jgi:hypothetical protein
LLDAGCCSSDAGASVWKQFRKLARKRQADRWLQELAS